ncbi:hypothetical protein U713_17010 [Rhodobacter capsulatus YW2]|nr:hypothetical protein U713_17010 [Rhodobacter capsulatus YW2]
MSTGGAMENEKKMPGRPKTDTEAVNLRLPRELIRQIDDRRRTQIDMPTRPEMIRRALIEWLEMTK